uniref:Uncharacterized protein n=1 Tax=Oryza brachyantha TaxID=4533 RepID=J3L4H8_ORYBR
MTASAKTKTSASAYMPPLVPGHMVKSTSEFLPQKKVMCVYLIDFMAAPAPPRRRGHPAHVVPSHVHG